MYLAEKAYIWAENKKNNDADGQSVVDIYISSQDVSDVNLEN